MSQSLQFKSLFNESSLDSVEDITAETVTINNTLDVSGASVIGLPVDNSSIINTGNTLSVKNGGITTTKLSTGVNATLTQVDTNTTNIGTLQGQMTTANTNIGTLQGQMTTANTDISTLQGQMSNKVDKVSPVDDDSIVVYDGTTGNVNQSFFKIGFSSPFHQIQLKDNLNKIGMVNGGAMVFESPAYFSFFGNTTGILVPRISTSSGNLTLNSGSGTITVGENTDFSNKTLSNINTLTATDATITNVGGRATSNFVINSSTSTDTAVPRFSGTGGKTITNSGVLIDGSNNMTGLTSVGSNTVTTNSTNNDLILSTVTTTNAIGCLRNVYLVAGKVLYTDSMSTTSANTDLNIDTNTNGRTINLLQNVQLSKDIYTTAYSANSWAPNMTDLTNINGGVAYTWRYWRRVGNLVFCSFRRTEMTVTTANISTVFSVALPVNQVTSVNGCYASNCFIYHNPSGRVSTGHPVDWSGSESNKVGIIFSPVVSGSSHYVEVNIIYESSA